MSESARRILWHRDHWTDSVADPYLLTGEGDSRDNAFIGYRVKGWLSRTRRVIIPAGAIRGNFGVKPLREYRCCSVRQ